MGDKVYTALGELAQSSRSERNRLIQRKFKQFCEILLHTGMRRSELLELVPEQIDFERSVILIENAKGKKRLEVPMTNAIRTILTENQPLLFRDLTKDQVSHKFTAAAKALGFKGLKLHSLRHTFGTHLIGMGYDITVVRDLLVTCPL